MKKRFTALDGLRGVAAIAVVYYHTWGLTSNHNSFYSNLRFGYLAVDLFFVLSGFVISYQYDEKFLNGMRAGDFIRRRIVRLYPLYLIGFALGTCSLAWLILKHKILPLPAFEELAFGALLLPSPTWTISPSLIPVLSPAWSLLAEFWVANIIYAFTWHYLQWRLLFFIIGVSAIGLLVMTLMTGTIDNGIAWNNMYGLFPRVLFSFFAGVVVQRIHAEYPVPQIPSYLVLIVGFLTFTPQLNGLAANVYELSCVIGLYPALIYLGAYSKERNPQFGAILGETSYALYVIHIPILLAFEQKMGAIRFIHPSYMLAAGFVFTCAGAAFLIQRFVDLPMRKALGRAMLSA